MTDSAGPNPAAFDYYQRLRRVKEYVEANVAGDLSLSALASVAGLADKYFSTFFHAKTGVRCRDWVASVRIERAMKLFASSDRSVIGVSSLVGFRDLRTFERGFRKHTGVTPLQYKKSVRPC